MIICTTILDDLSLPPSLFISLSSLSLPPSLSLFLPLSPLSLTFTQLDQLSAQTCLTLEPLFDHLDHSLYALSTGLHLPLCRLSLRRLNVIRYPTHTLHPLVREPILSYGRGEYVSASFPYMVRDKGVGGGASCVTLEEAVKERGFLDEGSGFGFGNVR